MLYIVEGTYYIRFTNLTALVLITWLIMWITLIVAIHRVLHNVKRLQKWIDSLK